ncbi:hypothetical protein F5Y03DRAFT_378265 [Xylaria venustula]|nr:hypothetical protein F5Y03DRAFT_378265 [Xylaria venustula]
MKLFKLLRSGRFWSPRKGRNDTASASSDRPESTNNTDSSKTKCHQLPAWFLEHCVQTPKDLETRVIPLQIRPSKPANISNQSDAEPQNSEIFQIEAPIYETMRAVLSRFGGEDNAIHFRNDAMFLYIPGEAGKGGPTFIESVVATFSGEIGASLVTLGLDDLEALTDDLFVDECRNDSESIAASTVNTFFWSDDESAMADKHNCVSALENTEKGAFLFETIFRSATSMSADAPSTDNSQTNTPIILHLAEADQYYYKLDDSILKKVLSGVQSAASRRPSKILVVASSHKLIVSKGESIVSRVGTKPWKTGVPLIPVKSQNQLRFLENGFRSLEFCKQENVKALNKRLRRLHGRDWSSTLQQLYCQYRLPADSKAVVSFCKQVLEPRQIDDIARVVPENAAIPDIERIIYEATQREDLISSFEQPEKADDKWSSFPESIRESIHDIERSGEKYDGVKKLLDYLVIPNVIDETLDDIELESDTKNNIIQLIEQLSIPSHERHGILKKARINGALLYGPPGTGKTLLARILAKECQATMISVTCADISNSRAGETEKSIQSLFSLGKLLFPSVLFIDEADSLFHARTSGDRTWERDQVNQLLTEMDGLVKSKTAPFVLLATNFPRHLDHAVLRRTPSRFHIGLPPLQARQRIFENYLRDDKLDSDVQFDGLALNTDGYSGSDIRSVCTKAAINRDADCLAPRRDGCKLLTQTHLYRALKQIPPTVSRPALSHIREFAKEHDPPAWAVMQETDAENFKSVRLNRHDNDEYHPAESSQRLPEPSGFTSRAVQLADSSPTPSQGTVQSSDAVAKVAPSKCESLIKPPKKQINYNIDFRYPKLNQSGKQIRVLDIETSSDSPYSQTDMIRCNLQTVDLEDYTPTYMSLADLYLNKCAEKSKNFGRWYASQYAHQVRPNSPFIQTVNNGTDWAGNDLLSQAENGWDVPMEEMKALKPRFCWGDYIALSYCWGDSDIREDISVNGCTFSVTRNLFFALQRLRDSYEVREKHLKIWIDAICINQNDLEERAIEVKRMQLIYSEAIAVRCWVGKWPQDAARGYDTVRCWLDRVQDYKFDKVSISLVQNPGDFHAILSVAKPLFLENYWRRVWVIQEISLASSLVFWYGHGYFTTEDLLKLRESVTVETKHKIKYSEQPLEKAFLKGMIYTEARLKLLRIRREQLATYELVDLAQDSVATDQRDKVYGTLALFPDAISSLIQTSYDPDVSADDSYVSLTRACIVAQGNLDVCARLKKGPSSRKDFPSWAIDLSSGLMTTHMLSRHLQHNANSGANRIAPRFSKDGLCLLCEGVVVDVIQTVGATQDRGALFTELTKWISEPMDPENDPAVTESVVPYLLPIDEGVKLSLARVLCNDSNYEFSQKPSLVDVPWISRKELDLEAEDVKAIYLDQLSMQVQDFHLGGVGQSWPTMVSISPLFPVFASFLHLNAAYHIRGVPLRNYFTCKDKICPDPAAFMEVARISHNVTFDRRLCTTQTELLGMAPLYAKRGDKIAVLYNCDMPVVLRPRPGGQSYEYIGSCFIEGLMKGEAIQGISEGKYNPVTISIS